MMAAMPRSRTTRSRPAAPLLAGLAAGVLGALLVSPALAAPAPPAPAAPSPVAAPAAAAPASPAPDPVSGLSLGDDRLPDCAPVVAAMDVRAKLGQRLMVGVEGGDPAGTAKLVHGSQVGGIFVGGNATGIFTGQALRGVQAGSRIPLAVAVDDEGGRVQRIDGLDGDLPSARTLARTRSATQVRQIARDRARAQLARGITMNLAPDVDVSDQPAGAVIGDRSFSNDPDTVTGYAAAYAQGAREAGIVTVLKHFPGHGHGSGDSHKQAVTTPPLDRLRADDLKPYANLISPGGALADGRTGVMVGHLDVPGLTGGEPATVSPAAYALLRGDYHFDGLVLTDDLGAMKAITDRYTLPQAVEKALAAGADMALWTSGAAPGPVLDTLAQALAAGRLDAKANDTAVVRILAAKGACARR
jgi:beta-N-acetylhexosaminidase